MLPTESSVYELGNTLNYSGVRESCGDSGWQGWPGRRTVMERGGGVRNDSGKSLHCALFQLPRVERGTPGPRKQFLWEWTLTSGFLNPGECFSRGSTHKPSHPNHLQSNTLAGFMVPFLGMQLRPWVHRGPACSPALEWWSDVSLVTAPSPAWRSSDFCLRVRL